MGKGDELIAAGQAQRWFDATGQPSVIVDQKGRARWDDIWEGNPAIVKWDGGDWKPTIYNRILNAPGARPYIVYPFTEQTGWTFDRRFRARENIAKIYLDERERDITASWSTYGPFVLFDPWSKHENLRWPLEHWQALLNLFPDVQFVQQSYKGAPPVVRGALGVDTSTFRDACALLAAATVYIRGESGMCHAAAALAIPTVTIWGACMDWDVLGGYPNQIGVGVHYPVCGRWLPCLHCASVMAAISPETVAGALRRALDRSSGVVAAESA